MESMFHLVFNSVNDAIFFQEFSLGGLADETFVDVNEVACRRLGYTREELLSRSLRDIVPQKKLRSLLSVLDLDRLIERKQLTCETVFVSRRGKRVPVEINMFLSRFDEHGTVLTVARDITDRRRRERRFKTLVANIPGAVYRCVNDGERTMEYVSDTIGDITGYPASDFIEDRCRTYAGIMHPQDGMMVREAVEDSVRNKIPFSIEYRLVRAGGDSIWVLDKGRGVFNELGELLSLQGVIFDITVQKQLADKLKEALEVKSRFLSTVSHELRTPLTAIKEGIGIVLDGESGELNREQQEFLDMAWRNVGRLHRLINQVLDLSKLEAGKIELDLQESDLNDAIEEVAATFRPLARGKGLTLEVTPYPEPVRLLYDADRIAQVISNIMDNAVRFTDQGGICIRCILTNGENTASIHISDTGPGISKEDLPKLFEPFRQVGTGRYRKPGHSGLGLAISKEIVEAHGGSIRAESEPGCGTEIIITLPVRPTVENQ